MVDGIIAPFTAQIAVMRLPIMGLWREKEIYGELQHQ
jgi:hypothetical protein